MVGVPTRFKNHLLCQHHVVLVQKSVTAVSAISGAGNWRENHFWCVEICVEIILNIFESGEWGCGAYTTSLCRG